jgi:hypothetical protein
MIKFIYDKVDVSIAIGATAFDKAIDLTRGTCVGVKFIPYAPTTPVERDHAIDINVESNGDKLIGKTDYRDFAHAGGSYLEAYKPCRFDTKAQVSVSVLSSKGIATAAFEGQLIFAIEQECND